MLVISNSTRGLNERYTAIIACAAAFTSASVLTLGMRVISKILMQVPLTSEGYTITLATAIYVVIEGLLIKGMICRVVPAEQSQTKWDMLVVIPWADFAKQASPLAVTRLVPMINQPWSFPEWCIYTQCLSHHFCGSLG